MSHINPNITPIPSDDAAGIAVDDKVDVSQIEDTGKKGLDGDIVVPVSHFADLSKLQTFKTFWRSALFCWMCALGAGLDGYQLSLSGSIIANPGFIDAFASIEGPGIVGSARLDPQHVSAWGAFLVAGNIFGAFHGGFVSDRFGRKFVLAYMIGLLIIANIIEVTTTNWGVWGLAKFIAGTSVGITQTQCVLYLSETAVAQIRGVMLSCYALGYGLGGLLSAVTLQALITVRFVNEAQLTQSPNASNYKIALYTQFGASGLFMMGWWYLPESPWWHARRGTHEKGQEALRYTNKNVKDYDAAYEYSIIVATIEQSRVIEAQYGVAPWREMFRGHHARRLFITAMCSIYCQLSGIALMFGYLTYFLDLVGFAEPFLISLISNFVLLGAIVLSFWVVEHLGRRMNYYITCTAITTVLLLVGVLGSIERTNGANIFLVFLCCLWVGLYACGPAVNAACYGGEISSPRFRAKTLAFGGAIAQSFALVITYCTPLMLNKWNVKTGYFFAAISGVGGVILLCIVPETKGRTFAELDELFERGISVRKFASTKTAAQLERAGEQQRV